MQVYKRAGHRVLLSKGDMVVSPRDGVQCKLSVVIICHNIACEAQNLCKPYSI